MSEGEAENAYWVKFIIKSTVVPVLSDHPQGMIGWLLNKVDH